MIVTNLFKTCLTAVEKTILIERAHLDDKEFHFQNWVRDRLRDTNENFDSAGRNSFPDFFMVHSPYGFEVKGLAYPGRDKNYDGNSQMPKGLHNGRSVYYVFGRYPKKPDGNKYPVIDLVICHGGFLNADTSYVHQNKNVKGFGSYGDIMIRDRKMYVVPTPYAIAEGLAHNYTLILPNSVDPGPDFKNVGDLVRKEADTILTAYSFNLASNTISAAREVNPNVGREHRFRAWRLTHQGGEAVQMKQIEEIIAEVENEANEDE